MFEDIEEFIEACGHLAGVLLDNIWWILLGIVVVGLIIGFIADLF